MANNRMYFVCNVCLPQGEKYDYDKWIKVSFHVAKWYPGEVGEWYTNATGFNFAESMDKFFEAHAHPDKYPGGVENPVRLDYEWLGTPFTGMVATDPPNQDEPVESAQSVDRSEDKA